MGHTKTSQRKKDHIELAFKSVVENQDKRFFYEPLLAEHPKSELKIPFLGKELGAPIWISSMTGGTKEAKVINKHLARACKDFKLGMGLGSCRIILNDDEYLADFQMRELVGDMPLYANLGVAQLEQLFSEGKQNLIKDLILKTEADGLVIHVNPLQEWLQPEGDRFNDPPIDTIKRVLDLKINVIVKEVGQGFGPESMKQLLLLPLTALEFGAHGGTNFSRLEMHRSDEMESEAYNEVSTWGHTAGEMVDFFNQVHAGTFRDMEVIISGGVKNFLDGYYLTQKIDTNAIYGQASALLKYARTDYESLARFLELQIEGYKLARTYLKIR